MKNVLFEIANKVRGDLEARQQKVSLSSIKEAAIKARAPHDFTAVFRREGWNVIAEIKRASPSQGAIAAGLDPIAVAGEYLQNGAAALSVLTEPHYFGGSKDVLRKVREQFPKARLLMKDFMLEPYQIYEARILGADAVLLIVALLGKEQTADLYALARGLGLSVLVEVHDAAELAIAQDVGADLIGINNRNLKTLTIDLATSAGLLPLAKSKALVVCESGIRTAADMKPLKAKGANGFLIGTSLMATGKPGGALAQLLKECGQ